MCVSQKEFAETNAAQETFEFIPFQAEEFAEQTGGMTRQEASKALIAITEDGIQSRGARAVFEMMKLFPGFWGVAGKILSIPPLAWFAEPVYRLFARHRHKISQLI